MELSLKEYKRQWYIENRERILKQRKEYYKDNTKRAKKWKEENREKVLGYKKEHYKNNREEISKKDKKYIKKFLQTDKGKAAIQRGKTKRRAREREIINTLTSKEWLDILEGYNYRCAYCDCEFDIENMPERDHVIPISKGGHNTRENVVPACRSCNAKKNDKILIGVNL